MRLSFGVLAMVSAMELSACQGRSTGDVPRLRADGLAATAAATPAVAGVEVSALQRAEAARSSTEPEERKIIRDGSVTLEVGSPADDQRKVASVAESHGGFVVTSEMSQSYTGRQSTPELTVVLVIRVAARGFDRAMEELRALGSRVVDESRTGRDVTEEFIDLDARLKSQKALEMQFFEIMKRATKVTEALDVQKQLAEVRTRIEQAEGRRRFLENQAMLSTIRVTLRTPVRFASVVGFWPEVRSAFADGVDVAAAFSVFLIRALVGLIPVTALVLPLGLIARAIARRVRRRSTPGRE